MTSLFTTGTAPCIVVIGASGGLGASTWAAALARRVAVHFGECVLVDADVGGGGLDMTCGTEHLPGLRWPDLARLRGVTSGERLVGALPRGEVPLLSAGGRGASVGASVVRDVLDSLRGVVPVVVDAGRPHTMGGEWVQGAHAVQVLSGLRARQLADTEALLSSLGAAAGVGHGSDGVGVGLITRSSGALGGDIDELIEHLGVPHLAHLRDDERVARESERGEWPGMRGPLRDTADHLVLDLMEAFGLARQGAA
ncbi:hypothetical protein [Knoellia subterranea]|uniref:Flp pilus assembly protein FlpE n=1 Tax=Knoellia subterranea KCTC 19937 TaxID=1385521 RepID=A0A0A0JPY9_9MICO|nr:hypothetical protein [Knoellia subterranea]KGN38097.1 flp pilus assembly protein FlpE [Knoellia subterranea KCTC 19937]